MSYPPPPAAARSRRDLRLLVSSARFCGRRLAQAFASRFLFAIAAVSLGSTKAVHVYAHFHALLLSDVLTYGLSFVAQDAVVLLLLHVLVDGQSPGAPRRSSRRRLATVRSAVLLVVVFLLLFMANISISFFLVTASELHWRNVGVAGSASSWGMLLTGLVSSCLTMVALLFLAWLLQDLCHVMATVACHILASPFSFLLSRTACSRWWRMARLVPYRRLAQDDVECADKHKHKHKHPSDGVSPSRGPALPARCRVQVYMMMGTAMLALVLTTLLRPNDSSLVFMSWTLPLMPFIDYVHSVSNLPGLISSGGPGINRNWDNLTALAEPLAWPWLPRGTALPGFEDWYEGKEHYSATADPLKIHNAHDALLPALRGKLARLKIRHVVLIKLESTRKDVFPIKKDGLLWDRLAKTWGNDSSLPREAAEKMARLTGTANLLTGDYDDGFEHAERRRRGGITVHNAHTTSTYTLKSLVGTLCGISPLVADFNVEWSKHVYQPCLPHILNALGHVDGDSNKADDFTAFPWRSMFMQSVTDAYDKQSLEMPVLGFGPENVITREYLRGEATKFGKTTMHDINYFGMAEVALKDYIRDAFASARRNSERVFLAHLTSSTHHPFRIPDSEKYVPLSRGGRLEDLSLYVNAVGYVDGWLSQILRILDDEGVADETLVVVLGDHGLSIGENKAATPYYQSNIGNFHIPMVLSHPGLPQMDVDEAVTSLQILPTILDLLVETSSLSKAQAQAAGDLLRNYEGQSLIRPLHKASLETGQANWQFTVTNPGRAMVAVRDARRPGWRLIVPVIADTEWRFTDVDKDPHEDEPLLSFGFSMLQARIKKTHGVDASNWAEEATFMVRWWVAENSKRWRNA